jgi:hypothetical protein
LLPDNARPEEETVVTSLWGIPGKWATFREVCADIRQLRHRGQRRSPASKSRDWKLLYDIDENIF